MSCNMVWLGCQKIQAQSQDQLVLTVRCAEHVGQDADPKEGRKSYLPEKKCLRIRVLLAKESFVYTLHIYYANIFVQCWKSNL